MLGRLALLAWLLLPPGPSPPLESQQRAPESPGTAVIRGSITAADTGMPVRGGVVTLSGSGRNGLHRTVLTDPRGAYTFTGLPAGSYRVRAKPGVNTRHVEAAYGQRRHGDGGAAVMVKDGEEREGIDIALPPAAVMAGRVVSSVGEPIARARVHAARVGTPFGEFVRIPPTSETDDLGRFRLHGLAPGEYIVVADVRQGDGVRVTEGLRSGFVTTYYPAARQERAASRLRLSAGEEIGDLQIRMSRLRIHRVSGAVIDSQGEAVPRPAFSLLTSDGDALRDVTFLVQPTGGFAVTDLPEGAYRLLVRHPATHSGQPAVPPEFASVPLQVYDDVENLLIATRPGTTVRGRVVFAEAAPAKPVTSLRVVTSSPGHHAYDSPSADVGPDLQFALPNLFGPLHVGLTGLPPNHAVESIRVGSQEITEEPFEFAREHDGHLEIVLTSRVGTLQGYVRDEDGEPAAGTTVLIVPEERASRRAGSPRLHAIAIGAGGRLWAPRLLPGRYYVATVPGRFIPGPSHGPEFFEPLVERGMLVVINAGETRRIDLLVAREDRSSHSHQVVPTHYGTFPELTGRPDRLETLLAPHGIDVLVLKPGETAS
jgi:hypothetical protein